MDNNSSLNSTTPVKAFAYLRVSDSSQIRGDGFTRQLHAINTYARAHNLVIVKEYREDCTGTEEARPVLAEMMLSLERNHHGVRTVIIEKLDRLARDLMVQEGIISKFVVRKYNLISAVEGADLLSSDPTRKFIRQVLGAVAELDKTMLVSKLRASRDRMRARTGRCEGAKGYRDTPEGLAILRRAQALRRRDRTGRRRTLQQIADILNAEGTLTLTGKRWSLWRVDDMLNAR